MNRIFFVEPSEIQELSDEQARELVYRLCKAELKRQRLSSAGVLSGGNQRARDGGIDVEVTTASSLVAGGYIPSARTIFQVKAVQEFPANKIVNEMKPKPKRHLRPAIAALAEVDGAYVIVSTKEDITTTVIDARVEAMKSCLQGHDPEGRINVAFYDASRMKSWVEEHPLISNWVKYTIGKPITGWRPYAAWADQETAATAEYLTDGAVRASIPGRDEEVDILSAINQLRQDLREKTSVRLVGHSGVGKTRLVQALFDDELKTEHPVLDKDSVIYTDTSFYPEGPSDPLPYPDQMVQALIEDNIECVVVVDNCGWELHRRVTQLAKGSRVHVITIEYDVRDDIPEGTACYRLYGASTETIKRLLRQRFSQLSDTNLATIAKLSDGNARLACVLADAIAESGGELAQLRDVALFTRLFHQKRPEDASLMHCAEVASLVYSFNVGDDREGSEMKLLADIADVTITAFTRNVAELVKRRLAQRRGPWRAILPHALSNFLAAQALDSLPKSILLDQLNERAPDRLVLSFSRRLGYLHESEVAKEIVREWLQPGGRYSNLTALENQELLIVGNIAPVQPQMALEALDRATRDPEFVSINNLFWSRLARMARSLAFEASLFDQAVQVLVRFAIAEPRGYRSCPANDMLRSLFQGRHSGTEAPPKQRANVVQGLLQSDQEPKQQIGLTLLNAGLTNEVDHNQYGYDFGARQRNSGWHPRTNAEATSWFRAFLGVAVEAGTANTLLGRAVRAVLGDRMYDLCVHAHLVDELLEAAPRFVAIDGWKEGWIAVRQLLKGNTRDLSDELLRKVRTLEAILAPKDEKGMLRALLMATRGALDLLDVDDVDQPTPSRSRRMQEQSEELGRKVAADDDLLSEVLPDLLRPSPNTVGGNVGYGIGQEVTDASWLFTQAREILAEHDPATMSVNALRGVLSTWNKRCPEEVSRFLDEAVSDTVWARWFPELQTCVELDEIGYQRLLRSLELGHAPAGAYGWLASGCVTNALLPEQVHTLVSRIAEIRDAGLIVALDILHMVVLCTKNKDDDFRQGLSSTCRSFIKSMEWSALPREDDRVEHDVEGILAFVLSTNGTDEDVLDLLSSLMTNKQAQMCLSASMRRSLLTPFFSSHPIQALDIAFSYRLPAFQLDGEWDEAGIEKVSTDEWIEWCSKSPGEHIPFAAQHCPLFEKPSSQQSDAPADLVLSETARRIFALSNNKERVLHTFLIRFWALEIPGTSSTLRRYLPLIATLNPDGDEELATLIRHAEENFKARIAQTEVEEQRQAREGAASFE